jgi:YidC/Oxa1 family membrane protein insertase
MLPLANIFQPLIDLFDWVIVFFHDSVGLGWGASIVALTVTVRAALLPLAFKQFHSMQSLAKHGPELKALQVKYKADKQRLQQETMKFYKENNVNPLASCLPLIAQLPVFLALFYMLREDLRVDICGDARSPCGEQVPGSAEFLFIPDLTDAATGGVLITLLLLYISSQMVSTLLMPTTVDRNQRLLFLGLPIIFIPFVYSFPAGLLLYWITTNLWTVVQQYVIRRSAGYSGWAANHAPDHLRPATAGAALAAGDSPTTRTKAAERDTDHAVRRHTPPPPPRKKKKRSGRRR